MHQPTTKLHYIPLCNTITMIIMNILITRLQSNTLQRISTYRNASRDVSLCHVIIILFYIILTLQILSINVTYLDISVSNIPIAPRHGLFCVCPQPIRVCITIQHRLWLSEPAQNDPCKTSKCNVVWYNICRIQSYWTSANRLRPDLKTRAHFTPFS